MCASDLKGLLLPLLAAAFLASPALAADKKGDAAKEQVRRLQQMSRKLEQEKAQLSQEKAAAEGRLKESEEKLGDVQGKVAGANRRAAQLAKDLEALRGEKDALAAKLGEMEKQLAETTGQYRAAEGERKRLEALAAQQKQAIASCEGHNAKLHGQGVALLEQYRSKGCFDAALQGEPFTGLKQVAIENFVEDNREKLDEHKIERPAGR
jgi:chromosome segregation ATPase